MLLTHTILLLDGKSHPVTHGQWIHLIIIGHQAVELGRTIMICIIRILLSSIAAATEHILLITTVSDPHSLKNFHRLIYTIMGHFHSIRMHVLLTLSHHIPTLLIIHHMVVTSSRAIVVDVQIMCALGLRRAM